MLMGSQFGWGFVNSPPILEPTVGIEADVHRGYDLDFDLIFI